MKTIMSSTHLGDSLARLVWESFADYLEREVSLDDARGAGVSVAVEPFVAEELLILLMWVHVRACQQAFGARARPAALKAALDEMHATVFEDLEAYGLPRVELPLFEQRVSARYAEYYAAAAGRSETVAEIAARHVSDRPCAGQALTAALAECTCATAGPLRDFLEEVVLA